VREANPIMQFCFAMEIPELERRILGKKSEPSRIEGRERLLTSRDVSSLVVDSLCDQAKERNLAVSCFYFDFASQKEQSPTSMLGALLK